MGSPDAWRRTAFPSKPSARGMLGEEHINATGVRSTAKDTGKERSCSVFGYPPSKITGLKVLIHAFSNEEKRERESWVSLRSKQTVTA